MTGELFDIYYGIKLVRELGYPVVICESDSKMTLQFIKDGVADHHPHASAFMLFVGYNSLLGHPNILVTSLIFTLFVYFYPSVFFFLDHCVNTK